MYQKSDGKLLCAQGKEDFANFLLSILTFPLGAVIRLLQCNSSMGSVDGLYKSVADFFFSINKIISSHGFLSAKKTSPPRDFPVPNIIPPIAVIPHPSVFPPTAQDFTPRIRDHIRKARMLNPTVIESERNQTFLHFSLPKDDRTMIRKFSIQSPLSCVWPLHKPPRGYEKSIKPAHSSTTRLVPGLLGCKPAPTPMISGTHLFHDSSTPYPDAPAYRRMIGRLIYLTNTRPDISFDVNQLAQFMANPTTTHYNAVLRVINLRHLHFPNKAWLKWKRSLTPRPPKSLNEDYFNTKELKAKLVNLGLAPQFKLSNQVLPISELKAPKYYCVTKSYKSRRRIVHLSDFYLETRYQTISDDRYETCNGLNMVDPISENGSTKGFVRGPSFYVATDNFVVSPISSISAISIVNNMNTTLCDIEEKEVSIGLKEGLSILKASLISSSALTDGLAHLLTNVKREDYLSAKVIDEK
ncbi:PREDICTED: uncharacterized protein LOC109352988 [Lupinus angustifolius]|uniref:uncharacterized protein LOC109352988 n=1 Tax=Lupinus angustifolius TaxID=3871 RepID=UPI00092EA1AD|nr:PREDICTED: uncharacterized protein LOC109352988 [Lupinus angustifolius]